ncbi:unnamed protein product [Cuscuta campestris]|uniref:Uncharacterized protein n=2 Tax=Cuscuta sect. Cleistogrammica TaxID=1824901 RepID=A0A484LRI7_9ASTE|nr:hypothetical protein DM860_014201 [Cuscuta australis]VFQ78839.1 unnamed protein product [Cuscuta campestris]
MHLWPSTRLRDSFKQGYLQKLEWNLRMMGAGDKQQPRESKSGGVGGSNHQKLLDDGGADGLSANSKGSGNGGGVSFPVVLCRDLLMILSCCYCCFCCGACSADVEDR